MNKEKHVELTEKKLMKVNEVCTALAISRSSVYRLMDSLVLKSVRIGTSIRVPVLEVERYLESLTQTAGA